jgi:hypothetical protein
MGKFKSKSKSLIFFDEDENDIKSQILTYLKYRPDIIKAWRQNAGKMLGKYTIGPNGISDIVGTLKGGRTVYIEVKKPGEKRSKDQVKFQNDVAALGALTMVVTSLDEVIIELNKALK